MSNGNDFAHNSAWWSRRWLALLNELGIFRDASTAQSQTRGSRVQRLEVKPGLINAKVRDRDLGECQVEIRLDCFTAEQWSQVIDALSSQAIFAAQLLAGDFPPALEEVLGELGISLLPKTSQELQESCDCCTDQTGPCRPLLATFLALGEMLNDDPWLLFRLRGLDRNQLLQDLRTRRNESTAGRPGSPQTAADTDAPLVYQEPDRAGTRADGTPLAEELDAFWGKSKPLMEFQHHISRPLISLALLRRLGPLPFTSGGVEAYELLSEIYQQVTDASLAMAYAPEPDDEPDEGDLV